MSVMPGDLVKLLVPVARYPAGTTARVIAVIDQDACVIEFDDGRELEAATSTLEIERWAALGMGQA